MSTGGPLVAILNKEDAARLDVHALDRVSLSAKGKTIVVLVNISNHGITPGIIGLFTEVLTKLNIKNNEVIHVLPHARPLSAWYIKKKLDGKTLTKEEIVSIVKDITSNALTSIDLTYFIAAVYTKGMNLQEAAYLAEALVDYGGHLPIKRKILLDKHCIGGVAGNRTTMVVVPIIAAAGYPMIKTSSRSITSPAGTADTMEVFAPVTHSKAKINAIMKAVNACMIWGGTFELASADDAIITLERILFLDPRGMLLASILSKKKAVGATHVIIDIPMGRGAKIKHKKQATQLARQFTSLGKIMHMKIHCIITDGSQPVGNGVGPILEARDVLSVLSGNGPADLRMKSLKLATELLRMAGAKNASQLAEHMLTSGKALEKFRDIIKAQGGKKHIHVGDLLPGKCTAQVTAYKASRITHIDNSRLSKAARIAGAPTDKGAGVYLHVKKGAQVKKGQLLYTVYAEHPKKLDFARDYIKREPFMEY